jgi:hypothetical protein
VVEFAFGNGRVVICKNEANGCASGGLQNEPKSEDGKRGKKVKIGRRAGESRGNFWSLLIISGYPVDSGSPD